jgi:hypothetical protein
MPPPEIAIFLGAGASCSEGAPNQAKLFEHFFQESFEDYQRLTDQGLLTEITALQTRLARFFDVFFRLTPTGPDSAGKFPTFEEALGIIDLALARDDGFRGYEGNLFTHQQGATLRNARRDFVFLIALILDKKLEVPKGLHKLLVQNLSHANLLSACAFVSFNYDILIDNALGSFYEECCLDYGIEFVDYVRLGSRPAHISLLKLHGSLNWLYCSTCRSISLTEFNKGVCDLIINPALCRCRKCGSLTVPIVVPPTYFKVLSNIFLQEVWHRAEQLLSTCRTWVFCGYSFPDATCM